LDAEGVATEDRRAVNPGLGFVEGVRLRAGMGMGETEVGEGGKA
jgi:hypothetical protein